MNFNVLVIEKRADLFALGAVVLDSGSMMRQPDLTDGVVDALTILSFTRSCDVRRCCADLAAVRVVKN